MPKTEKKRVNLKPAQDLNKSFAKGFDSLYSNIGIASHKTELDAINRSVDDIINGQLNNTKAITSDEMSLFLVSLFKEQDNDYNTNIRTIDDIFQADDGTISSFFQDRYQNQNYLYDDLNMICSQLVELEEAVLTTRDAIVTADDISKTVSRTITFDNILDDDQNVDSYRAIIENIEETLGLPKKIKNQVITNGLKYGKYYVYTAPYSRLFEQQYTHKLKNPQLTNTSSLRESLQESSYVSLNDVLTEDSSYVDFVQELKDIEPSMNSNPGQIKASMQSYCENITVTNDVFSIPLIEGTDLTQLMDTEKFRKTVDSIEKKQKTNTTFADGVADVEKEVKGKFDGIKDCYIKFIDPRKVIPVKILDTTIGYYYIHESDLKRDLSPFSTTIRVSNSATSKPEDVESAFISKIADKIIAAFDPKFVERNERFKDLIINALTYNNIYTKKLNFQFIPAEYMVEININEDENGEGQSILMRSLFYAKLYLALLVFKIITIITRSNDTRVYYVKNGGIDTNITNKIQDVARSIKAKQVSFMDLLNYNSIVSKVGAYKDVYMPVGRSGERGIEFDTIAGQQVDLNSEFMEFLRTNMINGTGVPSVIMSYINEADYSRTLQTANSKFANRSLNLQLDFNPGITKIYQNVLRFSNTPIPEEYINKLRYTLNPPRALNVQNGADNINTADQLILAIIKTKVGESGDSDRDNVIRDIMYNALARQYMPSFDWDGIDAIYESAILEAEKTLAAKNDENN